MSNETELKIWGIRNKISKINATKTHYLNWMECSGTEPAKTFLEYLEDIKASYMEEIEALKKEA